MTIDGVTELLAGVDEAWNAADAAAFAAHWTVDGSVTSPQGVTTEGRDAIERGQAASFATWAKGTTHHLDPTRFARLAGDVAVVDGTATIANLAAPDGTTFPPLSSTFTCVCLRHHGSWQIARMVSYTFLTP